MAEEPGVLRSGLTWRVNVWELLRMFVSFSVCECLCVSKKVCVCVSECDLVALSLYEGLRMCVGLSKMCTYIFIFLHYDISDYDHKLFSNMF